jgi:recombination protein RecA
MSASIEAMAKALQGAIGENATDVQPTQWLDSGYAPLNKIITGDYDKGWAYGRMFEIYGGEASGKTVLATLAMKSAQDAGGVAVFVDWERSFNAEFAAQIGLNTDFPHFIYKRPKTWEEGNTVAMEVGELLRKRKLLSPEAPIIAVFDSIAAAVPQSVIETVEKKGIAGLSMNDTTALARVSSTTLKTINQFVGEFNMVALYLNQIRTKPGVAYGDPTTTPGGKAMAFYASGRFMMGSSKIMQQVGGEKEFTGRLMTVSNKKNKLTRPFQSTDMRLIYNEDGSCAFDFTLSLIEYLEGLEVLPKGKSSGSVTFEGADVNKKELARKLDAAGEQAKLKALLPA